MAISSVEKPLTIQSELVSEREVLEGMSADNIVDLILEHGERVSQYERLMNLASEVLEDSYGVTVEEILEERNTNGKRS